MRFISQSARTGSASCNPFAASIAASREWRLMLARIGPAALYCEDPRTTNCRIIGGFKVIHKQTAIARRAKRDKLPGRFRGLFPASLDR
ncbi:hypothetical protein BMMON2_44920 [Burkholderia mallei]